MTQIVPQTQTAANVLTASELRAFLNQTTEDARRARTLVNITRRAESLFDDGYSITNRVNGAFSTSFTVKSPKGDQYGVCVEAENMFGDYCTCPAFTEYDTCKHLQACQLFLDEEAHIDAQAAHNALVADYYLEAFPSW